MTISFRLVPRIAAGLTTLALAAGAHAHNQWLLPSSTVLSKAAYVTFDGAVSTALFDMDHVPLNTDGLAIVAPDGSAAQAENLQRLKLRTVFDLNLSQPGTYRVAVVNKGLFASYKDAAGQTKRWRGSAEALATAIPADAKDLTVTESQSRIETFVTLGKPTALKPTNQGLELVPVTAPSDLAKGERATFALMLDGQPAAGVEVAAIRGGARYRDKVGEIKSTTDAAGRFSIVWPESGMYYIEASAKDARTTVPQARERRALYAATLEVQP